MVLILAGLLIPGRSVAEELTHIVGSGETIYSISRFYRVSSEELMRVNSISDPSRLRLGSRLTIPGGQPEQSAPPVSAAAQVLVDYRVVRGDTLFSIARTNGITLQNLLDINRFSSNHVIKVGDTVKVPSGVRTNTAQNTAPVTRPSSGLLTTRWPVNAKNVSYMTGQMGVVVEGEVNESVKSLTQGMVVSAGPWRKFGRVAIVEAAGGYFYMYGGCESLSVNAGDRVSVGTELGKLGINAVSEKPQLFFMVFRNDTPVDPATAPRGGVSLTRGSTGN